MEPRAKHYFTDDGKLIAFEKRLSDFNSECTEMSVVEHSIELYDNNFILINTTRRLDNRATILNKKECGNMYDWTFERRGTLSELLNLRRWHFEPTTADIPYTA